MFMTETGGGSMLPPTGLLGLDGQPLALTFDQYQHAADSTRLPSADNLSYMAHGLPAEAGEVASVFAKVIRDGTGSLTEDALEALVKELGDVLWFIAGFASVLGVRMEDIATFNLSKLQDRKARGVLQGSGDTR